MSERSKQEILGEIPTGEAVRLLTNRELLETIRCRIRERNRMISASNNRGRFPFRRDEVDCGGPGTDRKNVFAQSPTSQSHYDDVWGQPGVLTQSNGQPTIYARVKDSCDVCVRIILPYETGVSQFPFSENGPRPYRPTQIHVKIWEHGTSVPGRRFSN